MPPAALTAAIAALLEGVSRKDLERRAGKFSAIYRSGGTSASIADAADALAYLVTRLPATYAAIRAVFARMSEATPGFTPLSVLDVGAGPGTAAWAARDAWPSLDAVTLLEPNPVFRDLAVRLMSQATAIAGSLGAAMPRADLVTASYVLAELPEKAAAGTARELWAVTDGMLVLVEPGTPAGFARIRAARAALIEAGGQVIAPCTHDNECPMAARSVGESRSDQKTKQSVGESRSDQKTKQSVGESRSDQKTKQSVGESRSDQKTKQSVGESRSDQKTKQSVGESRSDQKTKQSVGESRSDQKTKQSVGESRSDQKTKQSVGESRSDQKASDWCHFSQRLPRSRDHMIAKSAQVPFEDERYAYVAVSRAPVADRGAARIIKPPVEAKAGVTFALCEASGLRNLFVARRDKEAFVRIRKSDWGDLF